MTARSSDKLEKLAGELKQNYGVAVQTASVDLGCKESVKDLAQTILNSEENFDLLVNNAGFGKWGLFSDIPSETYWDMINLKT